jgi:hypothetical protein
VTINVVQLLEFCEGRMHYPTEFQRFIGLCSTYTRKAKKCSAGQNTYPVHFYPPSRSQIDCGGTRAPPVS